jgi:hypothetical protein
MKTFKQFLLEAPDFEIERFKTDCAFVLEQLKGSHGSALLYRGGYRGSTAPPADWDIRKWERRRRPLDTSRVYHDAMNEWFKDHMGDKVRNWMFCTGYAPTAAVYAKGYPISVVFPIGRFEWVCSQDPELTDMTDFIANLQHEIKKDIYKLAVKGAQYDTWEEYDDAVQTETVERVRNKLAHTKFWHSTNLLDCIKSKTEIIFKCSKYYCFADVPGGTLHSPEMQELLKSL